MQMIMEAGKLNDRLLATLRNSTATPEIEYCWGVALYSGQYGECEMLPAFF
jgi:hypothetical protein